MRQLITPYTFDKTAKTVTATDFASMSLENIFVILNVSKNIVIYQANDPLKGGTLSGNTLTLLYDTSAMSNSDKLQILAEKITNSTETILSNIFDKLPPMVNDRTPVDSTFPSGITLNAPSGLSVLNTDLLTNTVNGWYDAASFQSGAIQIIATSGISAGQIIFEQTNDNSNTVGLPLLATEATVLNGNPNIAALSISASTNRLFRLSINARYIRVRISTAFVGGTVKAVGFFSDFPFSSNVLNMQQATAANLQITAALAAAQTLAAVTLVNTVSLANLGLPSAIADIASAALTTTTTTATLTPTFGCSYEVSIPVTAVTGTLPTLDIDIQESDDSGTIWFTVYSFPRVTGVTTLRSPKLPLRGNRVRYIQTVGGTTPSFTRAVNRLQSSDSPNKSISQLIDRSIVLTTLNSATPSLNVQNAENVQLNVNVGAITTTAPQLQLEGSDDNGVTWIAIGTPLTAVASSTVIFKQVDTNFYLIRARVSTAGVGVTAGYVLLKGY